MAPNDNYPFVTYELYDQLGQLRTSRTLDYVPDGSPGRIPRVSSGSKIYIVSIHLKT